jgi:thiol-disulfide isomerase/thioredoxin
MLRRFSLVLVLLLPACVTGPAIVGKAAPDFFLNDQKGHEWAIQDFKNGILLLDFWATWCQPCLEAVPDLNAFNDLHADKMKLLGVAIEPKGWAVVKPVIEKLDIKYPVVIGPSNLAKAYDIDALPTLVLIRDGKVIKELVGRHTLAELQTELSQYFQ